MSRKQRTNHGEVAGTAAQEAQSAKTPARRQRSRRMPTPQATGAHRRCLELVGQLLNAAIEALPEAPKEEDRVGRGLTMTLISDLFDTLKGAADALSLDELARVSRIVAEQRRVEVNSRKVDLAVRLAGLTAQAKAGKAEGASPALPGYFNQMVRELYGVSLEDGRDPAFRPAEPPSVAGGQERSEAGA